MNQILIIDLTKKYKEKTIIKNKSLTIDGDNYNFLIGPNGTGKTTFIKCLLGEIKYEGKIEKNNLTIAYAPENLVMPDYVTMYDFLKLLYLNKVQSNECIDSKIIYYLELFSIKDYKDMLICKLSKGTKQKMVLIQALFCNCDIYIFDEPFDGLDEKTRKIFVSQLIKIKKRKKIIIISTHYIKEYHIRLKRIFHFPLL